MLELVEVDLALGESRVGLVVAAEVDQLDRDALGGGRLHEGGPVRVACSDDADLDDVVRGVAAARCRARARGEADEEGHCGEAEMSLVRWDMWFPFAFGAPRSSADGVIQAWLRHGW